MSHGDSHSLLRLIRAASAGVAVVISVVSLLVGSQQGGVCPKDVKQQETLPPLRLLFWT